VTVNVDAGTCAAALANVTLGTPTIADNCSATASNDAPASFPLGTTTVTWTATDGSGNTATATQVVTVVDNIDPTITAPADVTVNVDAGVCSTALSNVTLGTPTTSDNCSVASVTNDAPTSFPLGNTTVTWTVTDGSGNTETATQTVTVIDNIDPTITCPSDITAYADATTNGTAVTWSPAVASDNCTVVSLTSDIASGSTFTLGATTVTYTATDQSGNFVTCTFTVTVLDTVSPVITNCPADITQDNDAGNCSAVVTWTAPTFFDNSGSYTTVWSHNSGDVFAVGTTTVTATVTDAAGNSTVCSFDVTVEDNEAPTITAPADVTVNADAGSCDALVSGVTLGTPAVSDNCGIASTTNNTGTSFVLGTNTITWTVTDIHGNSTTATQTVTVLDAEDPVVACPSDFTAYGAADSTLTSVSWTAATATDNCSIDTIYSDIQIGGYLPLGSTVVTYVAIDGSGNTDTCSFTITVVDTVSPVITNCPGDITQNNDLDSCGAVVNWTAPTYYDNSDYYTVSSSHASGDYFPVGTTTVTITVADSSGNTSVCEFDVTVVDNQAPYVIPFNSVAVTLGTDGMYTLAVNDVDSASYDNCGIIAKYLSKSFFNCNDVPSASTWLVIEDIHGNKDSSLVTVQVALNATPVLSVVETLGDVLCHGDSTGNASIAVNGGVSPYVYNWSNGSITSQAQNLSLGSYWYEVTDTNGCYTSDTVFIDQPDVLNVTSVKSLYTGGYNVSIYGTADGAITTTVTGGLTPYTFDWNSGAYTTQNLVNVPAGIYTLTLLDSNSCSFTLTDTLTEPTELIATATSLQSVICPDDTAGIVLGAASGAVPPYTYSWDFGSTTDYNTGLSYGIYTVTVTDTNGAVATDTVLVDALDYDCDGIYNVDEGGTPGGGGGEGDLDGDGIPNQEDEDSDGDGLPDSEEFDYDNDGVGFDDCDGDGIPNFLDPDLCELLVSEVITPNGDGDNDYWEIRGISAFEDNMVQIFNRYGEVVYKKENYQNEFNGRANTRTQMNGGDGLLPTGTYFYIVKVYETGDSYTGYLYITK
jgi:gliding motility-associated-like protein